MAAQHVMHIQKSLDQMNLQLHHVLSEITGLSGQRILDAILAGERDPIKLAKFPNCASITVNSGNGPAWDLVPTVIDVVVQHAE